MILDVAPPPPTLILFLLHCEELCSSCLRTFSNPHIVSTTIYQVVVVHKVKLLMN